MFAPVVPAPRQAFATVSAAPPWPGVWRACELQAPGGQAVWPSGHAALDAELPGGGWPCGALVEVLQAHHGHTEWQMVLPALAGWQHHSPQPGDAPRAGVVLVGPPHVPLAAGLQAHGLLTHALVSLTPSTPVQRLWACEQALQSPAVGAVLAWLPHAPMEALRRLQHAAARHGGLLWVFRSLQAQQQASAAPLRLRVEGWTAQGALTLSLIKRRGSLLGHSLELQPLDTGLQATLAGARWRNLLRQREVPVVPAAASVSVTARPDVLAATVPSPLVIHRSPHAPADTRPAPLVAGRATQHA